MGSELRPLSSMGFHPFAEVRAVRDHTQVGLDAFHNNSLGSLQDLHPLPVMGDIAQVHSAQIARQMGLPDKLTEGPAMGFPAGPMRYTPLPDVATALAGLCQVVNQPARLTNHPGPDQYREALAAAVGASGGAVQAAVVGEEPTAVPNEASQNTVAVGDSKGAVNALRSIVDAPNKVPEVRKTVLSGPPGRLSSPVSQPG